MGATSAAAPAPASLRSERVRRVAARAPRPELLGLLVLAGVLNLWALSRNGWANDYYSAAVRSMSTSWHNFLFASLDPSGVMTVDKPPLAPNRAPPARSSPRAPTWKGSAASQGAR